MTYRLANAIRNIACDAVVDAVDTGGTGTLQVRTGSQPTNVDDAAQGTLLGTVTFSATAFGNAGASVTGRADADTITSDSSADASGTAGHFRLLRGSGAIHSDGTCGMGSGDLNFDNNVIVAGGVIAVSSFQITCPVS